MRIVLGSSSAYRQALLRRILPSFDSDSPEINEIPFDGEAPRALARRLAGEKAAVVAKRWADSLVIGCDQVAILNRAGSASESVLGKPGNFDNAFDQLTACSGQQVEFYTACSLINTGTGKHKHFEDAYTLHFKILGETTIQRYLHREKPYDCAGSIKSEGLGVALIERYTGADPSTLIGLPLIKLVSALEDEDIQVI